MDAAYNFFLGWRGCFVGQFFFSTADAQADRVFVQEEYGTRTQKRPAIYPTCTYTGDELNCVRVTLHKRLQTNSRLLKTERVGR